MNNKKTIARLKEQRAALVELATELLRNEASFIQSFKNIAEAQRTDISEEIKGLRAGYTIKLIKLMRIEEEISHE